MRTPPSSTAAWAFVVVTRSGVRCLVQNRPRVNWEQKEKVEPLRTSLAHTLPLNFYNFLFYFISFLSQKIDQTRAGQTVGRRLSWGLPSISKIVIIISTTKLKKKGKETLHVNDENIVVVVVFFLFVVIGRAMEEENVTSGRNQPIDGILGKSNKTRSVV